MKKKIQISIFLCLVTFLTVAQNKFKDIAIPETKEITYGTLENGMTYYIYPTDFVKDRASYYIIQNVGSILESDAQCGLAHFLEHMAFNGTEHFAGKGILDTLEKHGAVFGKHINAYTGFDETVYNISNIPTNVDGLIDTSLLILEDWANGLVLKESEIDAERGVIKEEWRSRQNAQMRVFQSFMPEKYNYTKYAKRVPIGSMDVIANFKYEELRDFYRDWYRTDLQAIAVIGDVNVEEIEAKIKERFSKIPAIQNPIPREEVIIPYHKEPLFKLVVDKEVSTARISFQMKHANSLKSETAYDLQQSMYRMIALNIIASRINELLQKPETPFLAAAYSYQKLNRSSSNFMLTVIPKPNKQKEALRATLKELMKAKTHGVTTSEIERTITLIKASYENFIEKQDEQSHKAILNVIQAHYLENKTMSDVKGEYVLIQEILKTVNSDVLKATLNKLYTKDNRVLLVTGVVGEDNLEKEEALQLISKVENEVTEAYIDTFSGKSLMEGIEIKKGAIIKEEKEKEINATIFTLSNGVKVYYKYANKNKNQFRVVGVSDGGSSLYKDIDQPSLNFATTIASQSGLSIFSLTDLNKILTGKTANVQARIDGLTENISGASLTKDAETLFQLMYLKFTAPRFDKEIYDIFMNNLSNSLETRYNEVQNVKRDSLTFAIYGKNNPKARVLNQKFIEDISFERLKEIYKERFYNISDFKFYIVGDIDEKVLKPYLERYIASINGRGIKESWKDNSVSWIESTIDKDIYIEMKTPKAAVNIKFKNSFKYSLKNSILASLLRDVLQLRYTEILREGEGGTYGASVRASLSQKPTAKVQLSISFNCDPSRVESLIPLVYKEIEKIKKGEILQEDIDKSIKNYIKTRIDSKNFNIYSYSQLYMYFTEGYNIDDPKNYELILNKITKKDFQKFVNKFMNKNVKSYEIVFKPKKVVEFQ